MASCTLSRSELKIAQMCYEHKLPFHTNLIPQCFTEINIAFAGFFSQENAAPKRTRDSEFSIFFLLHFFGNPF